MRKMASHKRYWLATLLGLCVGNISVAHSASWEEGSERGRFVVRIEPVSADVEIGAYQDWLLTLTSATGQPVRGATIDVGGGMRGHGHGLPTQPLVSEAMRAGQYRIAGIKLNMRGAWTFAFSITTADGSDRVLIEIDLQNSQDDLRTVLSTLILRSDEKPPASASNRVADDATAARFGKKLFFDERLSGNGKISCATCHQPDNYFVDGRVLGQGMGKAMRNTPSVIGAAYQAWFYWDGRRDSLWSQALVPFEAVDEMGSSRVAVVRRVYDDSSYRRDYQNIFGELPTAIRPSELPLHSGPLAEPAARESWHRLNRTQRDAIDQVFSNVGKAIAAFERTLPVPETLFDRFATAYIDGEAAAVDRLSPDAWQGLQLFLDDSKTSCLRCHNGPMLTNNGFHNIGTGNFEGASLDFGRVYGLQSAVRDAFNCLGPHSDAEPEACTEWRYLNRNSHVPLEGAFKVPSLRGLAFTAPYMHDGRFATLEEVVDYYRNPPQAGPPHELQPLTLTDDEARQLLAFLKVLSVEQQP